MLSRRAFRSLRGAVGFIWFFLVAINFFFIAMVISIDMSKILSADYEVALAAQAAAQAGAASADLNTNAYHLSNVAATTARDTWDSSLAAETMPHATIVSTAVDIASASNPETVTMTVTFTVPGLFFSGFFNTVSPKYTVSATAYLCVPSQVGANSCVPPITNN